MPMSETLQRAGVHPYSSRVGQGSASGHDEPDPHGTADAQSETITEIQSKPEEQAPLPQVGMNGAPALENELNKKTAEAATAARTKWSSVMSDDASSRTARPTA